MHTTVTVLVSIGDDDDDDDDDEKVWSVFVLCNGCVNDYLSLPLYQSVVIKTNYWHRMRDSVILDATYHHHHHFIYLSIHLTVCSISMMMMIG